MPIQPDISNPGDTPLLVLGAGSWGTALALVLARNGHPVHLWDCNAAHIRALQKQASNNTHLPGFAFPQCLKPELELQPLLTTINDLIIVVPCEALHDVLARIKQADMENPRICIACKGLEPGTHKLGHAIVCDYLDEARIAVLSGPSFAREVAAGLPTAVAVVSGNEETAAFFSGCFHNEVFRIYTHDDLIGVQVGGAVKNVLAIAAGIADGLGFGANTRAALITRGLAEITRLGLAMGARQETFMGLAGLGDLVLTCTDDQSRNRRLGLALAAGRTLDAARREIGQAIEGVRTAQAVHDLAEEYAVEMPISEQILRVLNTEITPQEAVQALLAREPKTEI